MQYLGGEKFAGEETTAPAVSFPEAVLRTCPGLPDGATCSLAKRSASEEVAVQVVAESARIEGEG